MPRVAAKIRPLGLAAIAVLCACQRDYGFHTVAVYEAPRGHYTVRIEGQGIVRAGHDISQQSFGQLTVTPSSHSGPVDPAAVAVKIALRGSQVHYGGDLPAGDVPADPGAKVLSRLLEDGGYAVHPDELDELATATEGVLLGPKGTLMAGQSKWLRVVSTSFDP
jgi:hypothetical protein